MVRSFSEWKTITISRLIEIKKKNTGDDIRSNKIARDVDVLITKLQYLRARDLGTWLVLLYHASADSEEFLELAPTAEEIKEWFKEDA